MSSEYIHRDRFDFEIGHLKQSPCETCKTKTELPNCAKSCQLLAYIQTVLASGISSTKSTAE